MWQTAQCYIPAGYRYRIDKLSYRGTAPPPNNSSGSIRWCLKTPGGDAGTAQPAAGARAGRLRALATDAARQLDVLGLDRHALGVDRREVGVLEEADQVRLGGLLQGKDGRALEAQVRLELLRDLADEALERQLADEQLRRLLVAADLAERDRARAVAVGLLDAARRRGGLARRLGGELLAGRPEHRSGKKKSGCGATALGAAAEQLDSLATGRLAGSLLRAGHFSKLQEHNL